MQFAGLIALCSGSFLVWGAPKWLSTPTSVVNNTVYATCVGSGPDLSTARVSALNDCRTTASEYLSKEYKINSLTVETEKSSALHATVSSNATIKNLNCKPLKEEVEELEDQFKVYLQCKIDLNKAVVKSDGVHEDFSVGAANSIEVQEARATGVRHITSDAKSISVAVIPGCDSILITGLKATVIECKSNPVAILIDPTNTSVIVRKSNYKPKTISVKDILQGGHEGLQVILERSGT